MLDNKFLFKVGINFSVLRDCVNSSDAVQGAWRIAWDLWINFLTTKMSQSHQVGLSVMKLMPTIGFFVFSSFQRGLSFWRTKLSMSIWIVTFWEEFYGEKYRFYQYIYASVKGNEHEFPYLCDRNRYLVVIDATCPFITLMRLTLIQSCLSDVFWSLETI